MEADASVGVNGRGSVGELVESQAAQAPDVNIADDSEETSSDSSLEEGEIREDSLGSLEDGEIREPATPSVSQGRGQHHPVTNFRALSKTNTTSGGVKQNGCEGTDKRVMKL